MSTKELDDDILPKQPEPTIVPPRSPNFQQINQQQQQQIFVVRQPVSILFAKRYLTRYPSQINCPVCNANVTTRVKYRVGEFSWVVCGVLCCMGCWLGCQFIPMCVRNCKDVEHFCPNCNSYVGRFSMF